MYVEVHPLEAEITDFNESVTVLRNMMHNFVTALDGASPTHIPEHRANGSPYIEHIQQCARRGYHPLQESPTAQDPQKLTGWSSMVQYDPGAHLVGVRRETCVDERRHNKDILTLPRIHRQSHDE